LRQVWVWLTPAASDDYDHALRVAPQLCRPLAAAMGDLRPAARCLADYAGDLAGGVGLGLGLRDGADVGDLLAAAVAERFSLVAGIGRWGLELEDGSVI
jgi:hypothetical protein